MVPISSSGPMINRKRSFMFVDTDPSYQPLIDDGDSLLVRMNKHSGQAEEDDGLISPENRRNQDGMTSYR